MPTLRSETTHLPQLFSLTGMTAQAASESVAVASGASRKTPLSAPAGMIGSLKTNFRRSANDWRRPKGPTTFGPRRICTAAHTLRSMSSRKATQISSPTSTRRLHPTVDGQPEAVVPQHLPRLFRHPARLFIPRRRGSGPGALAFFNALISAMTAEARAIGLVR